MRRKSVESNEMMSSEESGSDGSVTIHPPECGDRRMFLRCSLTLTGTVRFRNLLKRAGKPNRKALVLSPSSCPRPTDVPLGLFAHKTEPLSTNGAVIAFVFVLIFELQ